MENKRSKTKQNSKKKNMIAMDNQPFSITSYQGSIELLAALEPGYLIPSTKYFTDTTIPHTYESLKIKIQTELSEASFCHLQVTYGQIRRQRHHIFL